MDPRRDVKASQDRIELLWDPRVLYKFWLDALSQATDAYFRSAAFLQLLQHGFQAMSGPEPLQGERPTQPDAGSPATSRAASPPKTST